MLVPESVCFLAPGLSATVRPASSHTLYRPIWPTASYAVVAILWPCKHAPTSPPSPLPSVLSPLPLIRLECRMTPSLASPSRCNEPPLSNSLGPLWWRPDSALLPQANLVGFLDEGYLGHARGLPRSLDASRCLPTRCAPQVERLGEASCLDAEVPRESWRDTCCPRPYYR